MLRTRVWRPVGGSNQSRVVVNQANIGDTVRSPRRDVGTEGQSTRAQAGLEMLGEGDFLPGEKRTRELAGRGRNRSIRATNSKTQGRRRKTRMFRRGWRERAKATEWEAWGLCCLALLCFACL